MKLSEGALTVLKKRYLQKDDKGNVIETPEQMIRRVAVAVAKAESTEELREYWAKKFYNIMDQLLFLPNSPTLMNAGRKLGQLSACFVLPIEDSIEGIFTAVKNMAMVQKSGGGTGFSFSRLRPKGSRVSTTSGLASGPVSFMRVFNAATEEIKQGGTRRGANMAILRVDHPDIMEFIRCKDKEGEFANFNISVGVTDAFMEAVKEDRNVVLWWHNGIEMNCTKSVKAREIFDTIVEQAWKNGEPGVVFLDTINRSHPLNLGDIESTNPCGEQPLLPYESCNLGSINLAKMVKEPKQVDWELLKDTVATAVRFLDDVIDVNVYPIQEIEDMSKGNRKIGLGVMGWADMLCQLRIPYDSERAITLAKKVMSTIQRTAYDVSKNLAEEKGCFPNIECSWYTEKIRNATRTTIAPTGTLSMIADCSSGIEPLFGLVYEKAALDNQKFLNVNEYFLKELTSIFLTSTIEEIKREIIRTGSCQEIMEIPEDIRAVYKTASEISPAWHIEMQAAFQQFTDNAVSKTINLPYHATKEDVARAIMTAYEKGCKGLTLYRVGSRQQEVLTVGKSQEASANEARKYSGRSTCAKPIKRPDTLNGTTTMVRTGCGKMYVTVNSIDGKPVETFIMSGSEGGCTAFAEGTSRLISLALRANVDLNDIVKQLASVRCPHFMHVKGKDNTLEGKSCPEVISRVLKQYVKNEGRMEGPKGCNVKVAIINNPEQPRCPECGAALSMAEGCMLCKSCGYSKCS